MRHVLPQLAHTSAAPVCSITGVNDYLEVRRRWSCVTIRCQLIMSVRHLHIAHATSKPLARCCRSASSACVAGPQSDTLPSVCQCRCLLPAPKTIVHCAGKPVVLLSTPIGQEGVAVLGDAVSGQEEDVYLVSTRIMAVAVAGLIKQCMPRCADASTGTCIHCMRLPAPWSTG
jgi:hypothetical protein